MRFRLRGDVALGKPLSGLGFQLIPHGVVLVPGGFAARVFRQCLIHLCTEPFVMGKRIPCGLGLDRHVGAGRAQAALFKVRNVELEALHTKLAHDPDGGVDGAEHSRGAELGAEGALLFPNAGEHGIAPTFAEDRGRLDGSGGNEFAERFELDGLQHGGDQLMLIGRQISANGKTLQCQCVNDQAIPGWGSPPTHVPRTANPSSITTKSAWYPAAIRPCVRSSPIHAAG